MLLVTELDKLSDLGGGVRETKLSILGVERQYRSLRQVNPLKQTGIGDDPDLERWIPQNLAWKVDEKR
jgi:hypothetical protein